MSNKTKTTALHPKGRESGATAKRARADKDAKGIPLIVIYWAFGLGLLGYILSRFVFTTHPLHWASGAAGLLLGVIIGYVWFITRGDVGLV